jgi:hypothetical protein
MSAKDELKQAIREAEKAEHKLEQRVESLKHQDDVLHNADAISRAFRPPAPEESGEQTS